jgi:type IV pilus assembly protein PilM
MPIIGLDLSKNSFKAVELERKKDTIVLEHFGVYENADLDLYSEKREDVRIYAKSLENFINEHGFVSRNAAVGLEETNVYMRIISLPSMKDKELKHAIQFEAEQYIPLPLNEVNITYQKVLGGFVDKDKTNIQLVAAKKVILEKYVDIVKKARLTARAIEPEAVSLARILGDTSSSPSGTVIVAFGGARSLVIVVYAGVVQFTRTIPIGGDVITKAIKQNLGLELSQAEEYKKAYGLDAQYADGKVANVIKPLIDTILTELKRAVVFFTNQRPSANIKKVVLTGGSALMPGLILYAASNLDHEVQLAKPLRNIQITPQLEKHRKFLIDNESILATAIGLALKEV